MRNLIFCLLAICLASPLHAQPRTWEGKVTDATKHTPLQGASVTLCKADGKSILAFAITDEDGTFHLNADSTKAIQAVIRFSCLGYASVTRPVQPQDKTYRIALQPKEIQIKEVIVKAPKIRAQGDTIIYNVARFSKEGDRTIGDILKKLPGIQVADDGKISYQGTPINKFYIEGKDLLGGKYGIATNSISNQDVNSVEVMENHQPIKALSGLSLSDQAAINLRLKENVKQRWIGNAKGGAGIASPASALWEAEGIAMQFNRKFQSLNTYKTNNTGKDVTREFKSFDINVLRYRREKLSDYIQIVPPSVQALTRERELFNRTHQVTSNNLFQLKNGMNVTTSLGYINHRTESDKQTLTEYYQADADTTTIREGESSLFKQQQFSAEVRIEANEDTYNLTERLQADFSWLDKADGVSGSIPNTQDAYSPDKQLTNDLYLLKRFGNKFIIFTSYTFLQDHPQRMNVVYGNKARTQRIEQRKLFSDNKIDYGFVIGQVMVSLAAGAKVMWRDMDSELEGITITDNDEGKSSMNYTQLYLTPKLEYTWHRLKTRLSLPVNFYHYLYKEKANGLESPSTHLLFNPDLYLSYTLSADWDIDLSGGITSRPLNDGSFYPGYLMDSYRTLMKGYPVYGLNTNKYIEGGIYYKRTLDEFFADLSVSHSWMSLPYLSNQAFEGDFIIASYQEGKNTARQLDVNGNVSKGFDFLNCYIYLQGMYTNRHSMLVRNEERMPNVRSMWSIGPRIEADLTEKITLQYELSYGKSKLRLENEGSEMQTASMKQSLSLRITPLPKLSILLKGEHFRNTETDNRKRDFFLADAMVSYQLSKRCDLELNATNLLDEREYAYTTFTNEASTVSRSYRIRPRNLLLTARFTF